MYVLNLNNTLWFCMIYFIKTEVYLHTQRPDKIYISALFLLLWMILSIDRWKNLITSSTKHSACARCIIPYRCGYTFSRLYCLRMSDTFRGAFINWCEITSMTENFPKLCCCHSATRLRPESMTSQPTSPCVQRHRDRWVSGRNSQTVTLISYSSSNIFSTLEWS